MAEILLDETRVAIAAPPAASDRNGTQSLARGIRLMRAVATRPQFGWRLSDLAAHCGLDKGTVHRMLACLVDERLVEQRASDRHYLPGPLMYELGLALPDSTQFQRSAEARLQALVRQMSGVALLLLRSGSEYVCSLRTGSFALTPWTVAVTDVALPPASAPPVIVRLPSAPAVTATTAWS